MRTRRVLLLLSLAALVGFGIGDLERGNRLYRAGHYAEAVQAYEQALRDGGSSPQLEYNLGTALLQLGRYAEAEQHLNAALAGVDPTLRERTLYNLGNRFLTDARKPTPGKQAAPLLDEAVKAYKRALRLQPSDREAKWNLELALHEQRQQKKKSPQSGGQSSSQQQKQSKGQGGGGGGAQQQGGSSQQGNAPNQQGLSKEQAERILAAADQDERQLYQQRIQKGQREAHVARDW